MRTTVAIAARRPAAASSPMRPTICAVSLPVLHGSVAPRGDPPRFYIAPPRRNGVDGSRPSSCAIMSQESARQNGADSWRVGRPSGGRSATLRSRSATIGGPGSEV